MKHFVLTAGLLIATQGAFAASPKLLADCQASRAHVQVLQVGSSKTITLNGKDLESVSRAKKDGYLEYTGENVKLTIYGSIRSFGRLQGDLEISGKSKDLLCNEGADVEIIAEETDLY